MWDGRERAVRRFVLLVCAAVLVVSLIDPEGAQTVGGVGAYVALGLGVLLLIWFLVRVTRARRSGRGHYSDPIANLGPADRKIVQQAWRTSQPVPAHLRPPATEYAKLQDEAIGAVGWSMAVTSVLTSANVLMGAELLVLNATTLGFVLLCALAMELIAARWRGVRRSVSTVDTSTTTR